MSFVERIESLESKHSFLESEIHQEMGRALPDLFLLRDLKVRKLRVKEEITRMINVR